MDLPAVIVIVIVVSVASRYRYGGWWSVAKMAGRKIRRQKGEIGGKMTTRLGASLADDVECRCRLAIGAERRRWPLQMIASCFVIQA